jgi:hypothetical protein
MYYFCIWIMHAMFCSIVECQPSNIRQIQKQIVLQVMFYKSWSPRPCHIYVWRWLLLLIILTVLGTAYSLIIVVHILFIYLLQYSLIIAVHILFIYLFQYSLIIAVHILFIYLFQYSRWCFTKVDHHALVIFMYEDGYYCLSYLLYLEQHTSKIMFEKSKNDIINRSNSKFFRNILFHVPF